MGSISQSALDAVERALPRPDASEGAPLRKVYAAMDTFMRYDYMRQTLHTLVAVGRARHEGPRGFRRYWATGSNVASVATPLNQTRSGSRAKTAAQKAAAAPADDVLGASEPRMIESWEEFRERRRKEREAQPLAAVAVTGVTRAMLMAGK